MNNLLLIVVIAEMGLVTALLFKTPVRRLVIIGIDLLKQGKGPLVVKTVAATLLAVFASVVYGVVRIQTRSLDSGVINSTDRILLAERLLDASLMGFSMFLAITVDRVHYYLKELQSVRKEMTRAKEISTGKPAALPAIT